MQLNSEIVHQLLPAIIIPYVPLDVPLGRVVAVGAPYLAIVCNSQDPNAQHNTRAELNTICRIVLRHNDTMYLGAGLIGSKLTPAPPAAS